MSAERLDQIVLRLQAAASQLRSHELSDEDAASILEACAEIAGEASAELERRFHQLGGASQQGGVRPSAQDTLP